VSNLLHHVRDLIALRGRSEMYVRPASGPRRALDKGYTFRYPELEPALRDLLGR